MSGPLALPAEPILFTLSQGEFAALWEDTSRVTEWIIQTAQSRTIRLSPGRAFRISETDARGIRTGRSLFGAISEERRLIATLGTSGE